MDNIIWDTNFRGDIVIGGRPENRIAELLWEKFAEWENTTVLEPETFDFYGCVRVIRTSSHAENLKSERNHFRTTLDELTVELVDGDEEIADRFRPVAFGVPCWLHGEGETGSGLHVTAIMVVHPFVVADFDEACRIEAAQSARRFELILAQIGNDEQFCQQISRVIAGSLSCGAIRPGLENRFVGYGPTVRNYKFDLDHVLDPLA